MAQIPHLSKLLMHLFYSCATDNFALLINFLKLETKLKAEKASPYPFFTNSLCQKLQRDNNGLLVCFTQPTQCFSFNLWLVGWLIGWLVLWLNSILKFRYFTLHLRILTYF